MESHAPYQADFLLNPADSCRFPGPYEVLRSSGEIYREIRPMQLVESSCQSFQCYVCGTSFDTQCALRSHEAKVHQFHRCEHKTCNQVFPHESTLALHVKTFHRVFKCASCGAGVRGCALIPKHLCNHHAQSAPFVCICDLCNCFFLNPTDHSIHLMSAHFQHRCREKIIIRPRAGVLFGSPRITRLPAAQAAPPCRLAPVVDEHMLEAFIDKLLNQVQADPENSSAAKMLRTPPAVRNVYQFDPID